MKKISVYSLIILLSLITLKVSHAQLFNGSLNPGQFNANQAQNQGGQPSSQVQGSGDNKYVLLEPLPCLSESSSSSCVETTMDLNTFLGYVFKFLIAAAAFLAVAVIIWEGFKYTLSEVPSMKSDAKNRITGAILGLLGALASYLILATIDPRLVQVNSSIQPLKIKVDQANTYIPKTEGELNKMSISARERYIELENKSLEYQREINGLENKKQNDTGLTEDQQNRLDALKTEQADIKNDQREILGNDALDDIYASTLEALGNNVSDLDTNQREKVLILANQEIDDVFDDYENDMLEAGDLEALQDLGYKKEFYKEQMSQQARINDAVENYNNSDEFIAKGAKDTLNTGLEFYKEQLEKLDSEEYLGSRTSGQEKVEVQYRIILQERIDLINKTLGNNTVE